MASPSEIFRLIYELSFVDKGSRRVVAAEREVQRETKATSRALEGQDKVVKRSAAVAEQSARRQAAAAKKAAAEQGALRKGIGATARSVTGLVAGIASIEAAKKAVDVTESLAKTTLTLHKSFGLAVDDASRWAAVSTARGADGKQMTMGFKALSTAVRNAQLGVEGQAEATDKLRARNALKIAQAEEDASRTKDQGKALEKLSRVQQAVARSEADAGKKASAQVKVFQQLGISQQELAKHGNDMNWVLHAVSDGLHKMPVGTDKAALSAKLFGRTWTTIAPLVRDGSKALDDQLALADKYGATMGTKTVAELQEHIKAEREAKLAVLGLQVAFGTKVAPTLTMIIQKTSEFAAQMHSGAGAGGRFARQATEIADDLRPVANGLRDVGGFLVKHPKLVVAAAAAYASFKTVKGIAGVVNDVRNLSSQIVALGKRAAKTKIAVLLADGAAGAASRVRRALAPMVSVVSDAAAAAARAGSAKLGAATAWATAGSTAGRAFGAALAVGAVVGLSALAAQMTAELKKELAKAGLFKPPGGKGSFWDQLIPDTLLAGPKLKSNPVRDLLKKIFGGQRGGRVPRMAVGGLVPILAAGGEMHVDGGTARMIPGDPGRDGTMIMARPGSAILTADGQARMALGATVAEAVRSQAPHFAKGGVVPGNYTATAYGPPWGGIQGGGTTATGVNLRRAPHAYGVAVDPRLIPLGSQIYAWPNPFDRSGPFRAFDTGGAIKGHRLDFYDWRGREAQNRWGSRQVRVSTGRLHDLGKGSAQTPDDVTARVPLLNAASRSRAGLLDDAVAQGVAAGVSGLTRREVAAAARGRRGARANPIMSAIREAMGPTTREITVPAGSGSDLAGVGLPSGVSVPRASWNPAHRPIAKWIQPYLKRASTSGWAGTVVSGYRTRAEQARIYASGVRPAAKPGTSNHEGSVYPRGAVDVTAAAKLSAVLAKLPGAHLLKWAGAKDPVHFSHPHGGSYRRGGIVRMQAGGTVGGRLGSALSAATSFKGGSLAALDDAIGHAVGARLDALRAEVVRRVRASGTRKTVQRLQGVIDMIDFEVGRRIGRIEDAVERRSTRLDRTQAAAERSMRLAGVDASSPQGAALASRVQAAETGVRKQNVASLKRALTQARRTGDREVIRDVTDRLHDAEDALAESLVKQVETWRDQLKALGDEAVAQSQFRLGLTTAGGSLLEAWQRTAGVQDTAGGMAQRAQYIGSAVLPALQLQQQAATFAAQMAAAAGDVNGWRQAVQDAAQAAVDIANAQADAADLIRQAAQKAAQDLVDSATHGRAMADLGLQRLELEQQLIGTYDSTGGGQGRADFITQQVVPAAQAEAAALAQQLAVASATGDQVLATQIAEALYSKQNDVLQAQLDAQNAIKSNTDALKDIGGSTAFSYQGQTFTDLDAIRARVGA